MLIHSKSLKRRFSFSVLLYFCSFCLLLPKIINAEVTKDQPSKFSIGIEGALISTYRDNFYSDQLLSNFGLNDLPSANYQLGWTIRYQIEPKLMLQTGLNYSKYGFFYERSGFFFDNNQIPRTFNVSQTFIFEYLAIPVLMNYQIYKKNKFSLFVWVGILPSFLTNQKTKTIYTTYDKISNTNQTKTNDYNRFNLFTNLQFGMGYDVSSKIKIDINIFHQYGLIYINPNNYYNQTLYGAGLKAGVSYKL